MPDQKSHFSSHKINVIKPELPKGGGDLTGLGETFSPHEFSGASGLSIPLPVTPCRDFEPQVSLNYSSGNGNGPFGLGCELSLPAISRQTSISISKYNDSDTFLYTGDDYLVPMLDAQGQSVTSNRTIHSVSYTVDSYRPRTAGTFDIIERYTNPDHPSDVFWIVISVDNITSIFGKSSAAKIYDPAQPTHIYRWLLEETYDAQGNHQVYVYTKENGKNIPPNLHANRDARAQTYLSGIRYGNDRPIMDGSLVLGQSKRTINNTTWRFEIALDYGQYTMWPTNPYPHTVLSGKEWTCRQDPFSDYRSGFELRTYRLCRNILLFHNFPTEFQTKTPVLTHVLQLDYNESAILTLLTGIESIGYLFTAKKGKPSYQVKSLPPLELGYSSFPPAGEGYVQHEYEPFRTKIGDHLPGLSRAPHYQLVDLYGGGIPGVLYADGESVYYYAPWQVSAEGVEYDTPTDISFPLSHRDDEAVHTLTDLSGDGRLDVLVSTPGQAGYYQIDTNGNWQPWKAIPAFPNDFHSPRRQHVDVIGNGRADLLLIENGQVRVCPADSGSVSYGQTFSRPGTNDLPVTAQGDQTTMLTFTSLCGSGQSQLTRLSNGLVECWPSLGYGLFGEKITLENAPTYGPDFDVARVRFVDVDGSGLSDIAYIYPDRVDIFLNQSGNSFAQTPLSVFLPEPWDDIDQVQFADVRGNGTACLVFTRTHPKPRQWFYDFNQVTRKTPDGTRETISQKPYLLTTKQNNMGAHIRIDYASSTKFHLEDKSRGYHWVTLLPFPVQVVAQVTQTDQIANTATVSSYSYHQGYFDGYERQFMGFGRVDRTDTTSFASFNPRGTAEKAAYNAPPLLTKTWYHTGAWLTESDLIKDFQKEYWSGDPQAYQLPRTTWLFLDATTLFTELIQEKVLSQTGKMGTLPAQPHDLPLNSMFDPYRDQVFQFLKQKKKGSTISITDLSSALNLPRSIDADTWREAHRTLHGTVLHREVYGLDGTPWQDTPYTVSESQFLVKQVQSKAANKYAVFLPHERESIRYDYERNANDPRVSHDFTLRVDAYGQVLESGKVNYGRRVTNIPPHMDLQTEAQQKKIRIVLAENRYINSPELTPEPDFYRLGVDQESRGYEITGIKPTAGEYFTFDEFKKQIAKALVSPDANTMLHWERDYYYDAKKDRELPLGHVTAQGLHHRTEFIEFDISKIKSQEEFGFMKGNELEKLLTGDGTQFHGAQGGYITFPSCEESRYYWNPGSSQSYHHHTKFFLPDAYFDPFQYPYINHAAKPAEVSKAVATSYTYDKYHLLVTTVKDPLDNQTRITKIDYRTLHAAEMIDINDNTASVIVDPLGMVIATNRGGTQAGETVGFADLSGYKQEPNATVADIMKNPTKYLQSAATFFYYDLHAWKEQGIPAHGVHLNYDDYTYLDNKAVSPPPRIQKSITYSDGFGRHLQSKTYLDSTENVRSWDPNTKKVVEKTVGSCWLTSGAVRYDDKGQPVKQYEPYFALNYTYANESRLNQVGQSDTLYYDALGRQILMRSAEGFFTKTLFGTLSASGNAGPFQGYLNQKRYQELQKCYSGKGLPFQPTAWSSLSYDANDSLLDSDYTPRPGANVDKKALYKAKKFINTPFEHIEDSLGQVVQSEQLNVAENEKNATYVTYDILGDELTSADQRLHPQGVNNFAHTYNLTKEVVKVVSADAGAKWALTNVLGQPIYEKDARGTEQYHRYDVLHRPMQLYVNSQALSLSQIVKRIVYGDSQNSAGTSLFQKPAVLNLRGKPVISLDEAGLSLSPSLDINGQVLLSAQWLKSDYKNEANWDTITADVVAALAGAMDGKYTAGDFQRLSLPSALTSLLEAEVFITSAHFDAIGRAINHTDADDNVSTPSYYSTNWLKGLAMVAGKADSAAPGLTDIAYNAKGQRTKIKYGNRVQTKYAYDPLNFALTGITSTKPSGSVLQDLIYHHDPVGNVSSVTNKAIPTVFFKNQHVGATAEYTYDALYRLIQGTGREHAGLWDNVQQNQNKFNESFFHKIGSQLSDGQALQNYTQQFQYDGGGNLTRIKNSGNKASRWITIQPHNNRIDTSLFGAQKSSPKKYLYDANGNMTTLGATTGVAWNYRNNMQCAAIIPREKDAGDVEYYVYDGNGRRVRKVYEQKTATGLTIREAIYLGGIEVRRAKVQTGKSPPKVTEAWHTLRVMEGDVCFCVWRYWHKGKVKAGIKKNQLRYQLNDLLNSSLYELDEEAQIITYEEYYPYGGTSIIAAKSQTEVKTKHYQYSGKEKDNSTGLYYYGMRYYCPWLGRWTSADPAGAVDGLNLYAFVEGNPVTHVDYIGLLLRRGVQPAYRLFQTGYNRVGPSFHQKRTFFIAAGSGESDEKDLPKIIEKNSNYNQSATSSPVLHAKYDPSKKPSTGDLSEDSQGSGILRLSGSFDLTNLHQMGDAINKISRTTKTPLQGIICNFLRSPEGDKEHDEALIVRALRSLKQSGYRVPIFFGTTDHHPTLKPSVLTDLAKKEELEVNRIFYPYPHNSKGRRKTWNNTRTKFIEIDHGKIKIVKVCFPGERGDALE